MGQALNNLQANTAGGAAPANPHDPPVYMGHAGVTGHNGDDLIAGVGRTPSDSGSAPHDTSIKSSEAYLIPYQSDATREGLGQSMYENGLISDPNDFQAIIKAWQTAVDQAAVFTAAGRSLTPWDVLDIMAGNSANKKEPKSRTTTQTSESIPNQADINQIVEKVFTDLAGRAPNPSEIKAYTGTMLAKAQGNPTKSTTTTQYDAQGNASSSDTVTQQGYSASDLQYDAQQKVKGTDEYGAYQAAVPYYNILAQVINGGG